MFLMVNVKSWAPKNEQITATNAHMQKNTSPLSQQHSKNDVVSYTRQSEVDSMGLICGIKRKKNMLDHVTTRPRRCFWTIWNERVKAHTP